jgi:hypothetical protein
VSDGLILPGMTRVAYVTTANTGDTLTVRGPEGVFQCQRVDPHGVGIQLNGQVLSLNKELLAIIGRYFLAAGLLLGQDINAGWDSEDQHAQS